MELQVLKPVSQIINIQSKISYCNGDRAWTLVRLRKELLNEFPQLKRDKRAKFYYKATLHKDYKTLEKSIRKMKEENEPIPILLLFYKEKQGLMN